VIHFFATIISPMIGGGTRKKSNRDALGAVPIVAVRGTKSIE
jgi:hypothetical protein